MEIEYLIKTLKNTYPNAKCSLNFATPFELTIAVMLSAQCTDERVNKTTKILFEQYSTPQEFIKINLTELENLIRPCGVYKIKAKNIVECSKLIIEKYKNTVPSTIEELLTLPGIGRKSANVIMLEAFNTPVGIAVDTHVKRVSNRIGLSDETSPEKIEQDLLQLIPKKYYKLINHLFIFHGRNCCNARNPKCEFCPINKKCSYYTSLRTENKK